MVIFIEMPGKYFRFMMVNVGFVLRLLGGFLRGFLVYMARITGGSEKRLKITIKCFTGNPLTN